MAHPHVWEGLGGPPRGPVGVRWPTQMPRRVRESLPVGREVLRGPRGRPGQVRCPTRRSRRPIRRSEKGQKAHPEVRKFHPEVRNGSGGPTRGLEGSPGCLGLVRRPTQRSRRPTQRYGKGREAHPDDQKAHPDVWEGWGAPTGSSVGVGWPTQMPKRVRVSLPVG